MMYSKAFLVVLLLQLCTSVLLANDENDIENTNANYNPQPSGIVPPPKPPANTPQASNILPPPKPPLSQDSALDEFRSSETSETDSDVSSDFSSMDSFSKPELTKSVGQKGIGSDIKSDESSTGTESLSGSDSGSDSFTPPAPLSRSGGQKSLNKKTMASRIGKMGSKFRARFAKK